MNQISIAEYMGKGTVGTGGKLSWELSFWYLIQNKTIFSLILVTDGRIKRKCKCWVEKNYLEASLPTYFDKRISLDWFPFHAIINRM